MTSRSLAKQLQQLQADQAVILEHIPTAIALFDPAQHLKLSNRRFSELLGLQHHWLQQEPDVAAIAAALEAENHWSQPDCARLAQALNQPEPAAFAVVTQGKSYLDIQIIPQPEGGKLLMVQDTPATQADAYLMQFRELKQQVDTEVQRLSFLLELTEQLQKSNDLPEFSQFALRYLMQATGSAFGDIKIIAGAGQQRQAAKLLNDFNAEFVAVCGQPAVMDMQHLLNQGISYGQGLLWQVVESGQPAFVENYGSHPQAVPQFRHPAIGNLGIFPIPAADGQIIGILTLESRTDRQLQEAPQLDIVLAACQALGIAMERVQERNHLAQVNQDLERASQLKSEFLAGMSHELRTPLNSILGFSELLLRQIGGSLTDRQLKQVQAIFSSGQHLLRLINDILDLSKVEAGKTELILQAVDIGALCNQCLRMMQATVEKKRITLTLELDYRLDRAMVDAQRVSQMLINLLSNAVKFTPEAGQIKLSAQLAYGGKLVQEQRVDRSPVNPSTPYLQLTVSDSGIGIPVDQQQYLFQPFRQIDSSLSRKHEGTGLGLALTKRFAELHGGTVTFTSQEGAGSQFSIWLPLTELRQQPTPTSPADSSTNLRNSFRFHPQGLDLNKRILVVEDQLYNQALISEFLEAEGYAVDIIANGETMLETIHSPLVTPQSLPDLVMMDIHLPGMDGLALMRQLRSHLLWQQVPIVAVTAMAMVGDRDRCLEAGADAYLSKPLDFAQVLEVLRELIA